MKKVERAESKVGSALNGSTIVMRFDLSASLIYEHEKKLVLKLELKWKLVLTKSML